MSTPLLRHTQYTQLDPTTWCATAQIFAERPCLKNELKNQLKNNYKRERQRSAVRRLLQCLLNKLEIHDGLDEAQFPYQLSHSRHYVCFSHSEDKVAVALSRYRAVGIDIELQNISWHVAKRFYSDDEIAALALLDCDKRAIVSRLLWQIKESFIKIYQYKLAQGLGKDYGYLLPDLIKSTQTQSPMAIITDCKTQYQLAILDPQQTVIIF